MLSYILQHFKYKKILIYIIAIGLSVSTCIVSIYIYNHFDKYYERANLYYIEKKKNYVHEKMYRYFNLKNEMPYVDNTYLNATDENFVLWKRASENTGNICTESSDSFGLNHYYFYVYNEQPNENPCFSNDAIDKFYQNGGYFTSEELHNLNFTKLFDNNFVINNEGERLSSDSIHEIMETPVFKYFE